eukprot:385312-Hanusia_phi.AAC.3
MRAAKFLELLKCPAGELRGASPSGRIEEMQGLCGGKGRSLASDHQEHGIRLPSPRRAGRRYALPALHGSWTLSGEDEKGDIQGDRGNGGG